MSPRFLGCAAVIARSFARIHETNLKKQGVLPLVLLDPADYDLFHENSLIGINLQNFEPNGRLTLSIHYGDQIIELPVGHTFTDEQIRWFKAGSAMNLFR